MKDQWKGELKWINLHWTLGTCKAEQQQQQQQQHYTTPHVNSVFGHPVLEWLNEAGGVVLMVLRGWCCVDGDGLMRLC